MAENSEMIFDVIQSELEAARRMDDTEGAAELLEDLRHAGLVFPEDNWRNPNAELYRPWWERT